MRGQSPKPIQSRDRSALLIYLQDVGGAKYLLPLISRLLPREGAWVLAHPLSEAALGREGIPFTSLAQALPGRPPDEPRLRRFLRREGISRLICTLSGERDRTNALLVSACAGEGVPSFGVLDHWKGYGRLLDGGGKPRFAPDTIACIDAHAREPLERLLGASCRVQVIGHPHLERLLARGSAGRSRAKPRVLVVSQPETRDRSYRSIFASQDWAPLRDLVEGLRGTGAGEAALRFRPHPKEEGAGSLPGGVALDPSPSWEEALAGHEVFVGVDSMLLVEASLAGKRCISLALPRWEGLSDSDIPYRVSETVSSPAEAGRAVARALAAARRGPAKPSPDLVRAVGGSLDRGLRCLEEFLN